MTTYGLPEFLQLWNQRPVTDAAHTADPAPILADLQQRYGSPQRHYHTLEHIHWGLRRLDEMQTALAPALNAAVDWNALRLAMWFHDAVMLEKDDELLSAELARATLLAANTDRAFADKVFELIRATDHQPRELSLEQALLVDADLSILGAPESHFDHYEQLVRKEWSHIPDEHFQIGRLAVLTRFLQRPQLFCSDYGRARWEAQARCNLERSIRQLSAARTETAL